MNQESTIGFESNNYILTSALERSDFLPLELDRDFPGVMRPRQAGIEDRHLLEAASLEQRREVRANRLDLGKLRHGCAAGGPVG